MYNNQGQGNQGSGRGPLGFVVKGIASGIGLASESHHAHKEKKEAKKLAEAEEAHHPEEARQSQSHSPAIGLGEQLAQVPSQVHNSGGNQSNYSTSPTLGSQDQRDYGASPAYEERDEHQVRPER